MKTVVAIDGPAAAGKSSVARAVSLRLGYAYVDSGASYRAITWWILHKKANPTSASEVAALVAKSRLESGFENDQAFLRIDGVDATPHLRDEEVNRSVSPVSLVAAVRETLTSHLRSLACQRDVVVEGRDIGSIVFPDTPYKFYIDASQEVRQRRRNAEGHEDEISLRDRIDSSRSHAPLRIARGAILVDSTHLPVAGVVEEIIGHLKAKGLSIPPAMTLVYNIFYNLAKFIAHCFFSLRIAHPERMIEEGPLILAVNHSSYFDPPLVGICSRRAVYYLARKNLLEWPFLGPLFPEMNVIPVEREGNDMSALREVIKKIREGNGIVLFPEGTRSRDGKLQPARAGIGLVIAKTLAPVLPMRIFGAYDAFPKGSRSLRLTKITVVIGEPIRFTPEEVTPPTRETYQRLSNRVMEAIAALQIEE